MKIIHSLYTKTILMVIALMVAGITLVYLPSISFKDEPSFPDRKVAAFCWLLFAYSLFALWSYFIRKHYVNNYPSKMQYQDVSLEFSNINRSLKSEQQIFAKLSEISGNTVKEISLIYNMSKYFKHNDKLNRLLEAQADELDPLKIKKQMDKLKDIKDDFEKQPEKYFTGKGFIVFNNYKQAELFKRMYDKAYRLSSFFSLWPKIKQTLYHFSIQFLPGPKWNNIKGFQHLNQQSLEESATFTDRTIADIKPASPKPRYIMKTLKNLFFKGFTPDQLKSIAKMRPTLGEQLKIKRTIEPELINFTQAHRAKLSIFKKLYGMVALFVVLPFIAYFSNYFVDKYELSTLVAKSQSNFSVIMRLIGLAFLILVDQAGYFLIEYLFQKSHFIKASQMFAYTLAYYSAFNLLVQIVAPNFALKQAFNDLRPYTGGFDADLVVRKYNSVVMISYFKLIFSVLNFKFIKPILVNRFILHRNKRVQINSNIIFGVSFLITSVLFVAFFGSMTPAIFIPFTLTLCLLYYYDRRMVLGTNNPLREAQKRVLNEKLDFSTGLPVMKHYHLSKLPVTIFATALNILVVGTFILSCFGYYGIRRDIEDNQIQKLNFWDKTKLFVARKAHEPSAGRAIYSLFNRLLNFSFSNKTAPVVLNKHSLDTFADFINGLWSDNALFLIFVVYLIYMVIFVALNNSEVFISQVQKAIWKRQKQQTVTDFSGKSYRQMNPVYTIIDDKTSTSK